MFEPLIWIVLDLELATCIHAHSNKILSVRGRSEYKSDSTTKLTTNTKFNEMEQLPTNIYYPNIFSYLLHLNPPKIDMYMKEAA